jgi:hypothetical protein
MHEKKASASSSDASAMISRPGVSAMPVTSSSSASAIVVIIDQSSAVRTFCNVRTQNFGPIYDILGREKGKEIKIEK